MIINDYDFKSICEAAETEYEPLRFKGDKEKVYLTENTVYNMLEDLVIKIDHWKEKVEDLERYIRWLNEPNYEDDIPEIHGKGISW